MEYMEEHPLKLENRFELTHYLCDLHNTRNGQLSKPLFDCKKLEEVYGGSYTLNTNEDL